METFTQVIDRWPSLQDFASDARVKYGTAQVMRFRNSIDASHWLEIVSAAQRRGYADVTYEALARIAAAKKFTPKPKAESLGLMRIA